MIATYLFVGIIASIIGALPPGASNLVVIKTTVQENIQQSLKIGYGAGIGEVFLAFLALSFGMMVQDFFTMNLWVQFLLAGILGALGIYFIQVRQKEKQTYPRYTSKYITGFILSIINPPVLVYWVVVFSLLRNYFALSENAPALTLILFFTGVFLGKVITLYAYGKLGSHIQNKKSDPKTFINKVIGVVLISLALIQTIKLILY